jgi:hypothetical protein
MEHEREMKFEEAKKLLEDVDFYSSLKLELEKLPQDVKQIMLELINEPFFFEIGKALNSFPLSEKVNKFKLKQELESYMASRNYSDLDLDNMLIELLKKRYLYVKTESMPHYFCTLEFAQAVEIMEIIENDFISPLAEWLEKRDDFKEYKNLKRMLELQVYSLLK